ncbi:hypothetical protein [Haloquadratum walsbyi]|jgi:hypothetical protein|uniref:Uncharacterized protein n=1 Tax=Haloquadratum walsbyi J07HQW2 TaxID=1238425 RepID=U1MWC8_9EURY|nr:hypothetical protein [Haloquadratum walsbyi]ERG94739.1 MAG: hypothetical protein J07HQW2_01180 [Haloquadratum walsbyi J07HQW2]
MNERLLTAGIDRCHRAGLTTSRSNDAATPPVIARTTSNDAAISSDESVDHTERPVTDACSSKPPTPETLLSSGWAIAVETIRKIDPTMVLSRVWNNQSNNRATLFVVSTQQAASKIANILTSPVGVADVTTDGRQFYAGPDRVPLDEGGYAAVPTSATLSWHESRTVSGQPGLVATVSDNSPEFISSDDLTETTETGNANLEGEGKAESTSADERTSMGSTSDADEDDTEESMAADMNPSAGTRVNDDLSPSSHTDSDADADTNTNRPWVELRADGDVLVRLSNVDALACPPRERFPYAYHRDDDKQIRVLDFAGRPVERYGGIADMRHNGFQPVPAPLVPEHMFDKSVTGWWSILTAQQ